MNKRFSMLTAAAAVTALPLLSACGGSAEPQVNAPAPSASQVAAPSSSAPASPAAPSASASASSSPSAEPSSDPADETAAVKSASEKFVKATLTIGYPDKDFDTYIARLKPLLTKKGFADVEKSRSARTNIEKAAKALYAQKARTSPEFTSGVKVTSITADEASTSMTYKNRTQQMSGGKWKTVKTSAQDTATLELVKQGDKWLVDKL